MKKAYISFWAPPGTLAPQGDHEFTSEEDSLHFRISLGVVEVMDGNIVLAVYANIPVVARNIDRWKETK